LLLAGAVFLVLLYAWEGRRVEKGKEPLIRPGTLRNDQLRGGLLLFFFQYAVQAGMFFTVPLFLSVALGLSAVATGARLVPLSLALLAAALGVPRFFPRASPRRVIRIGIAVLALATIVLVAALDVGSGPEVTTLPLLLAGLGMGAMASQLGSVTVSAVPEEQSGEVGGVQNTFTNLGASVGTALVGSIMIAALTAAAIQGIQEDASVPQEVKDQAAVEMSAGIQFLSDAQLETALEEAGADPQLTSELLEINEEARIAGLRLALSVVALLALAGLFFSGNLPTKPPGAAGEAAA
jgi:hypothetical protein